MPTITGLTVTLLTAQPYVENQSIAARIAWTGSDSRTFKARRTGLTQQSPYQTGLDLSTPNSHMDLNFPVGLFQGANPKVIHVEDETAATTVANSDPFIVHLPPSGMFMAL